MVQHQRKSRCEWDHDQGPYRTASKIRGLMDGTGTGILYFQRDGTIRLSTMNNYADNLRRMQSICTKQDKTTQPLAQEVAQWRSKATQSQEPPAFGVGLGGILGQTIEVHNQRWGDHDGQ